VKSTASADRKRSRANLAGEIIGLRVWIADSDCKDLLGIEGKVVDETRNTFLVRTRTGVKRVSKAACKFVFPVDGIVAEGKDLVARPEDRTKKLCARR